MMKKQMVFLIGFVMIIVVLTIIFSRNQINDEKQMEINFEVNKVETTPALRSVFYNKEGDKLDLQRFVFYDFHDIKKGDIIVKDKNSEILRVYEIDSIGNRKILYTIKMQ